MHNGFFYGIIDIYPLSLGLVLVFPPINYFFWITPLKYEKFYDLPPRTPCKLVFLIYSPGFSLLFTRLGGTLKIQVVIQKKKLIGDKPNLAYMAGGQMSIIPSFI